MKANILSYLRSATTFTAGAVASNYIGRIIDRNSLINEEAHRKFVEDSFSSLKTKMTDIEASYYKSKEVSESLKLKIQEAVKQVEKMSEAVNKTELDESAKSNLNSLKQNLENILDGIDKSGVSLPFEWNDLSNYLNNLSLLDESAILHILLFLILLLTALNILAIMFGNDIIKYLNLENKYPSLSNILKLRNKLQRYYLF